MKVAIYARVSSDRQDVDLSISAQLRALREYAARNEYQVVREFVDEAESGRTADRPQFQRMIAEARRPGGPFELILVWKYSRFARSREDAIVFKSLLKKHGVRVVSITEPSEDSPTGRLMEAIIESLDEFYSANLAQEVLRGMREAASRGFFVASNIPYGYRRIKVQDGRKERPRLEPNPDTAPVVKRIYRAALESMGTKEICRTLNLEGVAGPKGKPWLKTTVHRILTNEAYTGTLVWGRISKASHAPEPVRVENAWEPLVEAESFYEVQKILHGRSFPRAHPRRTASAYLLSGLIKCGTCGKSLTGQEAKSGKFAYYICGTLLRRGRDTCDAPYLNAKKLEALVVAKVKERILTEENLKELVRLVNEELDAASHDHRVRLEVIEGELADAQRRLDRLYDALETGKLTMNDLFPRIQQLRHRQEQLQAARADVQEFLDGRREELQDLSETVKYVDDMRSLLEEGSLAEQKSFIRTFIREVVVKSKEEAVLRYTLPLPPDTLLHDRDSEALALPKKVLAIVHDGGAQRTVLELSSARPGAQAEAAFGSAPRRVRVPPHQGRAPGHPRGPALRHSGRGGPLRERGGAGQDALAGLASEAHQGAGVVFNSPEPGLRGPGDGPGGQRRSGTTAFYTQQNKRVRYRLSKKLDIVRGGGYTLKQIRIRRCLMIMHHTVRRTVSLVGLLALLVGVSLLGVGLRSNPAEAAPVGSTPNLVSITFFERTGGTGPTAFTFGVNSSQLTTRLSDPLSFFNNDFAGYAGGGEFYDVFYSDADGSFNVDGEFVTIEALTNVTLAQGFGGGLNIAEVQLNFADGSTEFANFVSSFVALGDNALPSTVGNAVDGNLLTHTTMGNTAGQVQRLRVTVGFTIEVPIDIKPRSDPNSINTNSNGTIPVAILSTGDFDAPNQVDKTSLTFGRTGDEQSLAKCTKSAEDVNDDGLLDLVCHFKTRDTGFQVGDTEGTLKGLTVDGVHIEGRDAVRIVH